jgi:hypothetical protein
VGIGLGPEPVLNEHLDSLVRAGVLELGRHCPRQGGKIDRLAP